MDIELFGDGTTPERFEAGLREAAAQGFGRYWTPQVFGHDALTTIAVAARNVEGIRVGTAVVPTYPRHPMMLAQQALTTINDAAQAAGRPAPQVVAGFPVCVTNDPDSARARAAKDLALYGTLPSYRAMLDREGLNGPEDVAIIGRADEVADRISALADCGVTSFGGSAVGTRDERAATRETLIGLLS